MARTQFTGGRGVIVKSGAGTGTSPLTSIDTAALHDMLTWCVDNDNPNNEYLYMTGVASTVAGSVVTYDELGITTLIVGNAVGPVAIAMAATVASTFGWYQVRGTAVAACDTIADNAACYIDGTAGRLDDAVVAGDLIANCFSRSTDTSNLCTVQINYPFVTDTIS